MNGGQKVRGTGTNKPIDRIGLCARCAHVEVVENSKGSMFYLCGLSKTNPRFPKYPRLPVHSCSGYKQHHQETSEH